MDSDRQLLKPIGCICPKFVVEGCPAPSHGALAGKGAVPIAALPWRLQLRLRLRLLIMRALLIARSRRP